MKAGLKPAFVAPVECFLLHSLGLLYTVMIDMKRLVSLILATVLSIPLSAQIATPQTTPDPVVLTLDDALVIALSENIAVKVADKEIT